MNTTLDHALGRSLDAQARNDEQARLLFNQTVEIDSAMERVAALSKYGVPADVIDELLQDLAAVYKSNGAERVDEQAVAAHLDSLLRDLRDRAANGLRTQLGVKALARAIRPLLRDVEHPGAKGVMARKSLLQLTDRHADKLALPSLAHELGSGPHAALMAIVEATA